MRRVEKERFKEGEVVDEEQKKLMKKEVVKYKKLLFKEGVFKVILIKKKIRGFDEDYFFNGSQIGDFEVIDNDDGDDI